MMPLLDKYAPLIFVLLCLIITFNLVIRTRRYKRELQPLQPNALLIASRRFDFLYQDVGWLFVIIIGFFVMIIFLTNPMHPFRLNFENFILYMLPVFLITGLYETFILRDKLIIKEERIAYSQRGIFSSIPFEDIQHIVIDEDNGKFRISHKDGRKTLHRRGIFPEDWERLGKITQGMANRYNFGIEVIPIASFHKDR